MTIRARTHRSRENRRAWLYSLIYASRVSVLTVLFLFVSFLIQPFHQALANESAAEEVPQEESPQVAESVVEQEDNIPELVSEVADDTSLENGAITEDAEEVEMTSDIDLSSVPVGEDLSGDENFVEQSVDIATHSEDELFIDLDERDTSSSTDTDLIEEGVESGTENESLLEDTNDTATDEESDEVVDAEEQVDTNDLNTVSNVVDSAPQETSPSVPATTTPVKAEYLVTEDNYYQFSRQSCVAVGDGTYHCSLNTAPGVDTNSVVYADRDVDGDMEIYLRTAKGDVEQLTDNNHDDSSPYLDVESLQIVWHRLVDDRYQIILYDLEDKKESQLTFSRTNNMEPKVSKDGVVWQAWDNNDWEIMHFDGKYTDQITSNTAQDVTPVIEDGYILWSVLGDDVQEAMVYSLKTGQTMSIADHEGGSIVNPRFVLVYDTKFDNGDIITQGFDPTTGISAPIAAKPAPEPIDIPHSDPTGEIRALIQNKSSQKENDVVQLEPDSTGPDGVTPATTTATSSDTLDLKQGSTDTDVKVGSTTVPTSDHLTNDFELTDFDLVITPTATSAASGATSSTQSRSE